MHSLIVDSKYIAAPAVQLGSRTYNVEHGTNFLPAGGSTNLNTGSQVQSGYAVMSGMINSNGSPISLDFVDGAPLNKDLVRLSNTGAIAGIVYWCFVVDRSS